MVEPIVTEEEIQFEQGVRPRSLAEYVGQERVKENLKVFIDATYEGDLMAAAGVGYHVGREANRVYGERYNGVQKDVRHHGHHFAKPISPYQTPGDPQSGLLPRSRPANLRLLTLMRIVLVRP